MVGMGKTSFMIFMITYRASLALRPASEGYLTDLALLLFTDLVNMSINHLLDSTVESFNVK